MVMKGNIKKIISLLLMAVMLFGCFGITGCKREPVSDGEFIYEYSETKSYGPFYSIIGSTEEGQKYKENVYVPTHYNGVPIRLTYATESGAYMGTTTTYSMQVNCKNLYFNYIQEYDFIFGGTAEYIFVPESSKAMSRSMGTLAIKTTSGTVYVSRQTYNYKKEGMLSISKPDYYEEINGYVLFHNDVEDSAYTVYIVIANTAYMFNYENAPNKNYFFINNFESESLIEHTPYEPIREGYTFAGWYKEPECVNIWDFATDRMPKFDYDSDGYITNFVETKLYAKWIKN